MESKLLLASSNIPMLFLAVTRAVYRQEKRDRRVNHVLTLSTLPLWLKEFTWHSHDSLPGRPEKYMAEHLHEDSRWFRVAPSVLQLADATEMRHQMAQCATMMLNWLRRVAHCSSLLMPVRQKQIWTLAQRIMIINENVITGLKKHLIMKYILTQRVQKSIVPLHRDHWVW